MGNAVCVNRDSQLRLCTCQLLQRKGTKALPLHLQHQHLVLESDGKFACPTFMGGGQHQLIRLAFERVIVKLHVELVSLGVKVFGSVFWSVIESFLAIIAVVL